MSGSLKAHGIRPDRPFGELELSSEGYRRAAHIPLTMRRLMR